MYFKKLPKNLKPREKAFLFGISKLNDIELLAIFLRSGSTKGDVLELSKKIISKYGNLSNLRNSTIEELSTIHGIGKVKSLEILSLFEFSDRLSNFSLTFIEKQKEANDIAFRFIGNKNKEYFLIIILNFNNEIIHIKNMYKGTIKDVNIDPKEVISFILKKEGKKVYCFHNHPSGNILASKQDYMINNRLKYYCNLFGIIMISHSILNNKKEFNLI